MPGQVLRFLTKIRIKRIHECWEYRYRTHDVMIQVYIESSLHNCVSCIPDVWIISFIHECGSVLSHQYFDNHLKMSWLGDTCGAPLPRARDR